MSPFAAFRRDEQKDDFVKLADEHMQHDLNETDRDCLRQAAGRISTPATVGTVVGLGLGIYIDSWLLDSPESSEPSPSLSPTMPSLPLPSPPLLAPRRSPRG